MLKRRPRAEIEEEGAVGHWMPRFWAYDQQGRPSTRPCPAWGGCCARWPARRRRALEQSRRRADTADRAGGSAGSLIAGGAWTVSKASPTHPCESISTRTPRLWKRGPGEEGAQPRASRARDRARAAGRPRAAALFRLGGPAPGAGGHMAHPTAAEACRCQALPSGTRGGGCGAAVASPGGRRLEGCEQKKKRHLSCSPPPRAATARGWPGRLRPLCVLGRS